MWISSVFVSALPKEYNTAIKTKFIFWLDIKGLFGSNELVHMYIQGSIPGENTALIGSNVGLKQGEPLGKPH